MKNKIFNVWIKELCSLVFVQSMQAFLLTIMLSIVVRLYVEAGTSITAKESMGVYAIFILAIIPKVELLVKKIFGLGSGVMDDSMMGSKGSLLKTGLAIRGAASILNNAGKAVGGVVGIASTSRFGSAGKKARIAKNNMDAAELNDKNQGAGLSLPGSQSGLHGSGGANGAPGAYSLNDLTYAIRNANKKDPTEAYDEARNELRKKRLSGLKNLTSGIAETAGAIGGASVGAIVGLGTGGDDVLTNMGIGAGIGDTIGKTAAEATVGTAERFNDWNYNRKILNKELAESNKKKNDAQNQYNQLINRIKNTNNTSNNTPNAKKDILKDNTVQENYQKAVRAKKDGNMAEYNTYRAKAAGAAQVLKRQQKRNSNDDNK